jgi:hypothetical protein
MYLKNYFIDISRYKLTDLGFNIIFFKSYVRLVGNYAMHLRINICLMSKTGEICLKMSFVLLLFTQLKQIFIKDNKILIK